MSRERFDLLHKQFSHALVRLHEALEQNETALVRDALIQRFEFTYELVWRCMFHWLRVQGERVPEVGRQVIQAAYRAELIADADLWERIKDYRDQTSQTYDEKKAIEVAAFVRAEALQAFDSFAVSSRRSDVSASAPISCFGIARTSAAKLSSVFDQWPQIERVWIYGSRARGDHRETSDIDLAVDAPQMAAADFSRLSNRLDELGLIYRIDLLRLQSDLDERLRRRIEQERKLFWEPRRPI